MSRPRPRQEWWTPAALADAGLPDVPATRQGVDQLAARLDWRAHPTMARRRAGRGGGWEYHWQLLPSRAQGALLKEAAPKALKSAKRDPAEVWAWFDGLPDAVKTQARERLTLVHRIEALAGPMGRDLAVTTVANEAGISARTVWNWLAQLTEVEPQDRLAYLAPRHRGSSTENRSRAEASSEFLDRLKAAYLRIPAPSFTASYDAVVKICEAKGFAYLTRRTARRWMDANVPRVQQVYAREGEAGLMRCFPPQIRDRSGLHALEGVCADCHKIDVFVQWPGIDKPVRPQIVAFQDLFSNKILSWRVDLDPNKVAVMTAFSDLIGDWGIPKHVLFDNGREFANKWITGRVPNRFRFKVREDDPLGIIPMFGCQIHWATPGHGQAKPIERGFRDFADRIAKDPRFAGAYVGHRPDAKPEDYGSRAIPRDDFLRILEDGIADHNARTGRLTATAEGRSFDQTFASSYNESLIRRATAEQLRLCLMGQEARKLNPDHGGVTVHKNAYWADWMSQHAGEQVITRFNPENLWQGVDIYTIAGEYLGFAECREKVGFFDLVGAKLHAKVQRARRKAEKELQRQIRPIDVAQIAAELDTLPAPEVPEIEQRIVPLSQARTRQLVIEREFPIPAPDPASDARRDAMVLDFRRAAEASASEPEDTPEDRFARALDIKARSEAGEPVGTAEARWYAAYRDTPEFTRQRMMTEDFGEAGRA